MASGRTIWADLLTDEERAVLAVGSRSQPPSHPDVLVIGGGVLGVTTALACHRAGLGQVALIEAGELGSGSTAGAAGLLIPEAHQGSDPEAFVQLARASLGLWRELESGTPGGVGLKELEWIGFAPLPAGFLADPAFIGGVVERRRCRSAGPRPRPGDVGSAHTAPGAGQPTPGCQPNGFSAAPRRHRSQGHPV